MNKEVIEILENHMLRNKDERGHLDILYEKGDIVLKRSFSKAGVFRGLHWQSPPHEQTKLIHVLNGRIIDFVADINQNPINIHYRELVPFNGWVKIDAHLAHGFYALENSEFEYLCIGKYNELAECNYSIESVLDAEFGIKELIMSNKDKLARPINNYRLIESN